MRALLTLGVLSCGATAVALGQSVAVIPFANASSLTQLESSNMDWIGESIAETLREGFASRGLISLDRNDIEDAFKQLRVKSRSQLTDASILKIAEAVEAERTVYGQFSFTPAPVGSATESRGSLRITARVLDRRQFRTSPEFSETGGLEDLATLQAHLAWRALMELAPKLAPPESNFASMRAPIRLDAEENYIRGLMAQASDQKEKYFLQAAKIDPRFSRPAFELGKIYYAQQTYRESADWLEKVPATDVHYREATFVLGLARFALADYAAAQKAFQTITAVVPANEALNNLAAAESRRNLPQAVEDFRKALEGSPNDPDYHFNLGYALLKKGDFAAAADQFRAVLDRKPGDQMATLLLGRSLKKQALKSGDTKGPDARFQALERIKLNFEERAYWELKALLESKSQ